MTLRHVRRHRRFGAFCALLLFAAALPAPGAETGAGEPAAADLREGLPRLIANARDRVFPALVNIEVEQVGYYAGEEVRGQSVGSGTILDREGHVLTNYHVVADGRVFTCTLADRRELAATLVGEDPLTDLAVLKLDLEGFTGELPIAELGDSSTLEVGDPVLAMGSPFALSRSVTLGIVSNVERVFAGGLGGGFALDSGESTGLFTRWIQHDALIQPGNSGGPLVDLDGKVVGINELGGNAIGFAIPANLAREVMAILLDKGEVPRSWIGAGLEPSLEPDEAPGVLIRSIVAGSPAERAGLEAGDLLVKLADQDLDVRFPEEVPTLMKRIADFAPGTRVEITVRRGDELRTTNLETELFARERSQEAAFRAWGLSVQGLTPRLRRHFRLDADASGVLVTGVRDGSPAALALPPLQPGDLLRAFDSVAVTSVAELVALGEGIAAREPTPEALLVEFDRNGRNTLSQLESKTDEQQNQARELPKAWLGVATQPVPKRFANLMGLPGTQGFRITRVYPGTEAARADLAIGDVIVAIDGEPLEPRGMEDSGLFNRRVQRLEIGRPARLELLRGGQAKEVAVTLERSRIGPLEAARDRDAEFELTVRELTFFDRDERRWDQATSGVLVDAVEPAGWAGKGGLRAGDLIQRLAGQVVDGLGTWRAALDAASRRQLGSVPVVVLRAGQSFAFLLEPDWRPLPSVEAAPE